jgi:thiol:disulfide interchange protein
VNKWFYIIGIAVLLIVKFFLPTADFSEDAVDGIQFQRGSLSESLTAAKNQDKFVFIAVYASWCGPCKRMKSKSFSDPKVGMQYNQSFVTVLIDGESEEGEFFRSNYGVKSYPTLLFLNEEGDLIARRSSFHSAKQLLSLASQILPIKQS